MNHPVEARTNAFAVTFAQKDAEESPDALCVCVDGFERMARDGLYRRQRSTGARLALL